MSRQYDIGFFSSADRGLDVLLDCIPKIEEKLGRKVSSCWAYGWNTFDQYHAKNPEMMKWKWQQIKKMNSCGMKSLGRLSHEELASVMKQTDVWAYPCYFEEIHCITALKAQAAGCRVVTSHYAALNETVYVDEEVLDELKDNQEQQDKFVQRVVDTLKEPRDEAKLAELAETVKEQNDWSKVAQKWSEALK